MAKAELATECFVTVDNKVGELASIFKILADAGINIRAFTAYVDGDYGFVKMVPGDAEKAVSALDAKGYGCSKKQVVLVQASDAIGVGASIAATISSAGLEIGHSHGSATGSGDVLLVVNCSDNQKAVAAINKNS